MIKLIVESLQKLLPEVNVYSKTITKNNDVILNGVVLKEEENNMAPIFYVDEYIQRGWPVNDIAIDIFKQYNELKNEDMNYFQFKNLFDYTFASSFLELELVNYDMNVHMWNDIPCKRFLVDLAIIVVIKISNKIGNATIKISNNILTQWSVNFDEAYELAYKNTMRSKPEVVSMNDMLESLGCVGDIDSIPMYVVTNESKYNGAIMMLNNDIFEKLIDVFHTDLIILPSSKHEVLVTPWLTDDSIKELNEMVKIVNTNELDAVDILSDHVYIYRKDVGWTV